MCQIPCATADVCPFLAEQLRYSRLQVTRRYHLVDIEHASFTQMLSLSNKPVCVSTVTSITCTISHRDRGRQLTLRERQPAHRERQLDHGERQLAHRERQPAHRERQLAHQERQLAHREQQLAHRERQLAYRELQLAHREQHFDNDF